MVRLQAAWSPMQVSIQSWAMPIVFADLGSLETAKGQSDFILSTSTSRVGADTALKISNATHDISGATVRTGLVS